MKTTSTRWMLVIGAAAVLAACGGGGDGGNDNNAGGGTADAERVPPSAFASVGAFVGYLGTLVGMPGATADGSEPMQVDGDAVAPTVDDDAPAGET